MLTLNCGGDYMIVYNKFFELAHAKNLSIEQLRKMLTPRTVYRLENNAEISVYIVNKICSRMDCQPGDFMEYVEDDEY